MIRTNKKHSINLKDSQANAFYIIGVAKSLLKDLTKKGVTNYLDTNENMVPYPSEKEIMAEFMSLDYENLIQTFYKYFGQYVDLKR